MIPSQTFTGIEIEASLFIYNVSVNPLDTLSIEAITSAVADSLSVGSDSLGRDLVTFTSQQELRRRLLRESKLYHHAGMVVFDHKMKKKTATDQSIQFAYKVTVRILASTSDFSALENANATTLFVTLKTTLINAVQSGDFLRTLRTITGAIGTLYVSDATLAATDINTADVTTDNGDGCDGGASDKMLSVGAIIGIVVGAVGGLCICCGGGLYYWLTIRRRDSRVAVSGEK